MKKQLRRTLLYVPSNNPSMIQSSYIYNNDGIVFDLEDSVSINQKDSARLLLNSALKTIDFGEKEVIVRINDLSTPWGREDLFSIVPLNKAVIRLPKVGQAEDIHKCEKIIEKIEKANKVTVGSTKLIAIIETAKGVINCSEIAFASKRLVAISLGAEDLVSDMGTTRSVESVELMTARGLILLAAKAAKIDAIDTVFSDINDEEGLIRETKLIKQMGFDGKSVINPRQIDVINEIFAPTKAQVEEARSIKYAAEIAEEKGIGVVSLNGKMVDKPIVTRAENILELAEMTGMLEGENELE